MQSGSVLKVKFAALLGALAVSSVFGAEVSPDDALCAVKGWVNLKEALGGDFDANPASVTAYDGEDGKGKFYVVALEGGGYVVASGDDEVTPILAYSREGTFEASAKNPLWCLLAGRAANEAERLAASAPTTSGISGVTRLSGSSGVSGVSGSSGNSAKWSRLCAAGGADGGKLRLGKSDAAPTDLRVPELLHSDWSQEEIGNYNNGNYPDCFNLYTPNHYPCGCVATSGAQLMRYFEWPKTSVTPRTFPCYTNNVPVDLTMMGGTYDWANMPLNINTMYANGTSPTVTTYREAIGKLTYDVGVSVSMSYDADGSGSSISRFPDSFKNVFGYSGAVYINDPDANDGFKKALLPNLDAKRPCGLGISGSGGHAVVADGYGYSDGTLYVHINSGWAYAKSATAWYAPPTFDFSSTTTFTSVGTVVFNIFTNETRYSSIASGRVLDQSGNPVPGAAVTAECEGSVAATATTDARGIYALVLPPNDAAKTYSVTATCPGYRNPTTISVSASRTTGWNILYTTNSNSYDNDISIEAILPVYAKLVEDSFHYYNDVSCSPESEVSSEDVPDSIAGCIVLFANDAEYQALVPYTNELATASGGMAYLQNNVTLTGDTDWSAMDFNLNGKVVTLQGWDLTVHKPQGEGRITSGNLINQTAFSVAYGAWNAGGGWYGFAGSQANSYGNRDVFQSFTVPKARDVYLQFRVHSWNNSGYNQYVSAGIDSVNNLIKDFQSGTKTSASSYYRTTGILKRSGLAEGSTHELQFTNSGGYTYVGDIFLCPTSKLIFDIPENEEYDLDGITLGGASDVDFSGIGLCVCKTGKGLLTMSKANPRFGGSGITALVVEDGLVKKAPGVTCGASGSTVQVNDGGQFDVCGADSSVTYDFTIAGSGPDGLGALVNNTELTGEDIAAFPVRNVTLSTNAVIGGSQPFSLRNGNWAATTTTLNGYTLTYTNATVYAGNVTYNNGSVVIPSGTEFVFQGHNSAAPSADVTIYGQLVMNNGGFTSARSLVFAEGAQLVLSDTATSGSIPTPVITGKYAPANQCVTNGTCTLATQPVQLGDASHLATEFDLSLGSGTFDGSNTTFYAGSTVTVNLGTREFSGSELLVAWPEMSTATFAVDEANEDRLGVWAKPEGLYIFPGKVPSFVKYDVANDCWAFYDENVSPYAGEWTLGMDYMRALFANDAEFQALASHKAQLEAAHVPVLLQTDITLTADADWRAIDFDMNGKVITLKGYDLKVRKPLGTGRITAGNLLTKNYSLAGGSYNETDWIGIGAKYSAVGASQNFYVPKKRPLYVKFKAARWNNTYTHSIYVGIDSLTNIYNNKALPGSKGSASEHGIWTFSYEAGSTHQIRVSRNGSGGWLRFSRHATISPQSHLVFDIPEGETHDPSNLTLGGSTPGTSDYGGLGLLVRKIGKGTLVMSKVNDFGGNGISSMIVEEGLVKKASGATCGAQYSRIVVEDGGQFDLNGRTYHDYDYTLAGSGPDGTGALISTAAMDAGVAYAQNTGTSFLRHVALSSNATVYAANNMGMIFYNYDANTMTMNGHTVTYDGVEAVDGEGNGTGVGAYRTFLGNMSYSGNGKIVVAPNGWVQTHVKSPTATDTDVEVYGRFWMNSGRLTPVKSLVFKEGALFKELNTNPGMTVVNGTYGPNVLTESTEGYLTHPKVQLGDASHLNATLDLSQWTTTFDDSEEGSLTFYAGTAEAPAEMTVTVEIGDRTVGLGKYAHLWKEKPAETVKFVRSENMRKRGIHVLTTDDGIRFKTGLTIHIR